jgi:hypothetical protein
MYKSQQLTANTFCAKKKKVPSTDFETLLLVRNCFPDIIIIIIIQYQFHSIVILCNFTVNIKYIIVRSNSKEKTPTSKGKGILFMHPVALLTQF